jgi:hypothetical protein
MAPPNQHSRRETFFWPSFGAALLLCGHPLPWGGASQMLGAVS